MGLAGDFTFRRWEDTDEEDLPRTFIDTYVDWAVTATDAPRQYHVVNAAIMMSAVMCPYITLETSYGIIKPNLWSMVLAGTTITRKSTTMDMALKMLEECLPDCKLGTDGSNEGLMSELALRDGQVSLFHRDEITGWMEAITKKDYMAGMLESLTRLYDGKHEKRVLRSSAVEVREPNFIIMSGGIKTKMQEVVTIDHIRSGFLPRFIIVSGTTKADEQRPIGPPPSFEDETGVTLRETVLNELHSIVQYFSPGEPPVQKVTIAGITKEIVLELPRYNLQGTPEAWDRIRQLKLDATKMGEDSDSPDIFIPIYDRLSNSVIKLAMLITGARKTDKLELSDVEKAITYADDWIKYAAEFAQALQTAPDMDKWEKKADKIVAYLHKVFPHTPTRTDVMKNFRIKSIDIKAIEDTLVYRGLMTVRTVMNGKSGRPRTEYVLSPVFQHTNGETRVVAAPVKARADIYGRVDKHGQTSIQEVARRKASNSIRSVKPKAAPHRENT